MNRLSASFRLGSYSLCHVHLGHILGRFWPITSHVDLFQDVWYLLLLQLKPDFLAIRAPETIETAKEKDFQEERSIASMSRLLLAQQHDAYPSNSAKSYDD